MIDSKINDAYQDALRVHTIYKEEDLRFTNIVKGISNTQQVIMPEADSDDMTFYFFTRPMMNLTDYNLYRDRLTVAYQDTSNMGVNNYIRRLLDPKYDKEAKDKNPLMDSNSPFINVFSNTLLTASGWPDQVIDSWVSPDGQNKIKWGYSVGSNRVHREFEMDLKFFNIKEEIVTRIIDIMGTYQSNVSTGVFYPSNNAMMNRYIDYQIGVYVIVTTYNYKIKKIAKTIGHFIANSKGVYFDYDRKQLKTQQNPTFSTRLKCFNAWYNDPILLMDFNRTVMAMNPAVKAMVKDGSKEVVEVPKNLRTVFQNEGVPFIDMKYNTLEWLIPKTKYDIVKKKIEKEDK